MSQSSSSSSSFEIRRPAAQPSSEPCRSRVLLERRDVEAGLGVDRRPRRRRRRRPSRRGRAAPARRSRPRSRIPGRRSAARRAPNPASRRPATTTMTTPTPGRFVAEDRAADRDRLPGHDLGDRVAGLHRVRVHHPGHRLLVRRHVRRRDVLLGPDHRQELGGEAAGQPLELGLRERARVAAHAALRAAVGQAEERALPRHPHRERRALAERDLEVVADPALRRPEDARVLDAVAGKDDPVARRPSAPGC